MLSLIFLVVTAVFVLAYFLYGKILSRKFDLSDKNPTPAHECYDGVDCVPAKIPVLFGHHFSSISGAGPVVGPIIAALAFGWLPALIWVVLGSIFIGGVHDFSAMVISIRNKGRSIAEIAKQFMSTRAYKLFLVFIWLALIYVLVVFVDLTAVTFVQDPGVASSSVFYIVLAVGFGYVLNKAKWPLWLATIVFVTLVFSAIPLGQKYPLALPEMFSLTPLKLWIILLLIYCFIASITPVCILLQPRDYLSSFLLYACVIGGVTGIMFGSLPVQYPAFIAFNDPKIGPLFPILFITVACGAISGFHAVVASGTSSKQLDKETDSKAIGYGAMLIEGMVAVMALSAVMIIGRGDELAGKPPMAVYAAGMAKFLSVFGINPAIGMHFGLLALSTFILTTLDTATRLSRYIFQEYFNMDYSKTRYRATGATVIIPLIFGMLTLKDATGAPSPAWKIIWPVFGASNQLLAGLVLLVAAVWLIKMKKKSLFVVLPMIFMLFTTLVALGILIISFKFSVVGIIAMVLFALALVLCYESYLALKNNAK
ncbi:MAG: hypothetical protein A2252_12400 [Elusimicrobia bacterium RIFOXYA2_FULL_39_19]|nr:MAG: hypothetical protein A2252_12400 [Elusimicrobia bacterium RIFOXYA2_FULL_39_19]